MWTIDKRRSVILFLAIIITVVTAFFPGCEEREEPEETTAQARMELSATLVPDTKLDIYVYISQEEPTVVPKDIIGAPFDVNVESLAVWGVDSEATYTLSGSLEFLDSSEAAEVHGQILSMSGIWTSLSKEKIYFVHGSGTGFDDMKSIIAADDFTFYNDEIALAELDLFPDTNTMKLIGLAVAKPGPALLDIIVKNTEPDVSELLKVLLDTANLQIITAGLYSQSQIDVSDIIANPGLTNILTSQAGILASAKSEWLGILVEPVIRKVLKAAGYEEIVQVDGTTIYRSYLDLGLGYDVPTFFRVEDNRIFVAVALQESYANILINNIAS